MLKLSFASFAAKIVLLVTLVQRANGQCYRSLYGILMAEDKLTNTAVRRTYVLCAGTTFKPTFLRADGSFPNNGVPLAVKANALIKCGASGSSSNKCKIDGTGSYAMFLDPFNIWGQSQDMGNIVLQGITVDFFISANQIPIVVGGFRGTVTFKDCIFSNNQVDPLFFIDQYVNDQFSRRALQAEASNETKKSGPHFNFKYYPGPPRNPMFELKPETSAEPSVSISPSFAPTGTNFTRRRLNAVISEGNTTIVESMDRDLQAVGKLTVIFDSCVFDFNSPVKSAKNQNALSVVRFRARNPPYVALNNPNNFREYVGTLDARFISCTFKDNVYSFSGDPALYRSMIDFNSKGALVMRNNCFRNSPVKFFGVITVQNTAQLTNTANFVSNKQSNLKCSFIARLSSNYAFQRCGPNALSTVCRATTSPAPAPVGGGFCFPGDAICDVEGQGEIRMRDLKLGDKVLVTDGTYEPVYSFGHYNDNAETEYLRIITTGRPLEMSKDHMVFMLDGRSIPASSVYVGDKLLLANGKSVSVRDILEVKKSGAYAPFTASGSIVVNGVKASSFVAFQNSETLIIAGYDTGLSFQFLASAFERPHRIWCQHFSKCLNESYTTNGISLWVDLPHKAGLWLVEQNAFVMILLGVPAVMLLLSLAYPLAFLVAVVAILCITYSKLGRTTFRVKSA